MDRLPELKSPTMDVALIADIMRHSESKRAFRYLTAPPISEDDLKTLAEASLAPGPLLANPDSAHRIRGIVCRILDPHRFPWIGEERDPKPDERSAAIIASAALIAAKQVETFRRNDAKNRQEGAVKNLLADLGMVEVKTKSIPNFSAAPERGEFMGETPLGGAKADVVARLYDGRILAVECKVSNSAVNSHKRLVHDTGGKAVIWHDRIGRANMIAAAVLNGVFSPANCESVQNDRDVFLFWDHRLEDLRTFVEAAK